MFCFMWYVSSDDHHRQAKLLVAAVDADRLYSVMRFVWRPFANAKNGL